MKSKKMLSMFVVFAIILAVVSAGSVNVEANTIAGTKRCITSENEYIKLSVDEMGAYTLGTTGEGIFQHDIVNKAMLYGFPDTPGTSTTSIHVDGESVNYGFEILQTDPYFNEDGTVNTSVLVFNDIQVTQILSFVQGPATGREDAIQIKYELTNIGEISHNVGLVIKLDTMLDKNDGSLFRINTAKIERETEYSGEDIPENWYSLSDIESNFFDSYGQLNNGIDPPPDKVQFADWRHLTLDKLNYEVDEDFPIGDSAVNIIWNEEVLNPGETKVCSTIYGLSVSTKDLVPPLAVSLNADSIVHPIGINYEYNLLTYDFFNVTCRYKNISGRDGSSTVTAENVFIELILPEYMYIEAGDESLTKYYRFTPEQTGELNWEIAVSEYIEPGDYPITIVCGADNWETKTVTRYVTISGSYVDNTIYSEEDRFQFHNRTEDFFDESESKYVYNLSDEYYDFLIKDMNEDVAHCIDKQIDCTWEGSCYGMSAVTSLAKIGYIHPSFWQSDAVNLHDLNAPKISKQSEDLVNFYFLTQYLPDIIELHLTYESMVTIKPDKSAEASMTGEERAKSEKDRAELEKELRKEQQSTLLKKLVKESGKVKDGGMPVVLSINFVDDKLFSIGHAVVAFDVNKDMGGYDVGDENTYIYQVAIYDSSEDDLQYIYINEDYTEWFYTAMYTKPISEYDENTLTIKHDNKYITDAMCDIGTIDIKNPETMEDRTIQKRYNRNFMDVINLASMRITFADGTYFNSYPSITKLSASSPESKPYLRHQISLLPEDEEVFTVTPQDESTEINAYMVLDGYFLDVVTKYAESAVYDKSGSVSLFGNKGEYDLELSFNKGEGKGDLYWHSVHVNGSDANEATLKMAQHGMIFYCDNMHDITIFAKDAGRYAEKLYATFSTDYDSVNIRNLDRDTFGVYIDSDNDGEYETLIADSNGTDYGTYEKPEDEEPTPSEPESSTPTSAPADETSKDERRDENKTETASDTSAMETSDDKDSSKTETSYEAESNSDISTSEYETKIISGAESGSIDKISDPQNSNIDETESDTASSQKIDSTNNGAINKDGSPLFTGENSILFITVLAVCLITSGVLVTIKLSRRSK